MKMMVSKANVCIVTMGIIMYNINILQIRALKRVIRFHSVSFAKGGAFCVVFTVRYDVNFILL